MVYRMEEGGDFWVLFCFMDRFWFCKLGEMEKVRLFRVGDKVRIRDGFVALRWGWGMEIYVSKG